jgi:hypothetical protein
MTDWGRGERGEGAALKLTPEIIGALDAYGTAVAATGNKQVPELEKLEAAISDGRRNEYLLSELAHARTEVKRLGDELAKERAIGSDPENEDFEAGHVGALKLIAAEDTRQIRKGRDKAFDDARSPDEWVRCLEKLIRKHGAKPAIYDRMPFWVKVARLGIAAVESARRATVESIHRRTEASS